MTKRRLLAALFFALLATETASADVLKPRRTIDGRGGPWWSIDRAASIRSWLLTRMAGEVLVLPDGAPVPRVLVGREVGGRPLLFSAYVAAASGDRVLVYDIQNAHLIEADLVGGRPRTATFSPKALPLAGVAWNGSAWVLAGHFEGGEAVQIRDAGTLKVVATYSLPVEESHRVRAIAYEGSVAAGPAARTVVVFVALSRAIVLDQGGAEVLSLDLPIAADQLVSEAGRTSPPRSRDESERLWAGRVIPVGVGWTGEDPSVLLQEAGPRTRLTWCRFSGRDGHLKARYTLDVPPAPRGGCRVASATDKGVTTLMVLKSWISGAETRSALFEFSIPE